MAVNLSPVGGVAAQFFTNNGVPLTGGKLFTYAAGTTTPAATYVTALGVTAWTNPIVLDAAGRVPSSGEIWLTDGVIYKFILKDSNDVLIATYDNITGINSNFVNFTASQEIQTATAGQTVFNLATMQYQPGTNSLTVYVDGVNQYGPGAQYAYLETDSDTVTFLSGLHVGASVKFTTATQTTGNATDASVVAYTPPFTGSVATNVEAKLAQYVSVKDFGAVGDGTTDDTAAIQAALDESDSIFFPAGEYIISATLSVPKGVSLYGAGYEIVILNGYALADPDSILYLTGGDQFSTIDNLQFKGKASGSESIGIEVNNGYSVSYTNLRFTNLSYGLLLDEAGSCLIQNCTFTNCLFGAKCTGGSGYTFAFNNFNYGTSTGIQVGTSPTTSFPTGIIVSQCLFTSNVGVEVPLAAGAYGGHNLVADQCYFEGDAGVGTITSPFQIGQSGTGNAISCVSITNCRMAQSSSVSSDIANVTTLTFAGNIVGTNLTLPVTVGHVVLSGNIFVGTLTNNANATASLDSQFLSDRFIPLTNGTQFLGDSTHRWNSAYIANSVILGTGVFVTTGINSPESSLVAPVGSLYLRTNGGANTTLYVKESGSGNTGWVAK